MPGFEPQTDVQIVPIRLHWLVSDTQDIPVLGVPDNANIQIELLSLSVAVGDNFVAGGTLSLRFGWVDDSASDAVTLLGSGTVNPETGGDFTQRVVTEVWRGTVTLDSGDTVFARCIAGGGGITFPEEETAIVEYRVLRHS
jgi:hypothetical protein